MFLKIFLRIHVSCEIAFGFLCGNMFAAHFPAGITAYLPADCSQESLLRLCLYFWQKIQQESFLRIKNIAGNNYPQRF
jgi:hypothetical protein